jgi:hypothetical protein
MMQLRCWKKVSASATIKGLHADLETNFDLLLGHMQVSRKSRFRGYSQHQTEYWRGTSMFAHQIPLRRCLT